MNGGHGPPRVPVKVRKYFPALTAVAVINDVEDDARSGSWAKVEAVGVAGAKPVVTTIHEYCSTQLLQ